jgi:hypothetical protein
MYMVPFKTAQIIDVWVVEVLPKSLELIRDVEVE